MPDYVVSTTDESIASIGALTLKPSGEVSTWSSKVLGGTWGFIEGTLADQTDLQAVLDTKGTSNFSGVYNDLSGKPTLGTVAATAIGDYATAAQGTKADNAEVAANRGAANGYAPLGADSKVPLGNLPAIGVGDVVGPVLAVDNRVAFFNGATGKIIKDSGLTLAGSNTGDNATNSQYSGLAASKQDTLVSGTNIKTINGSTVLGSGDLVVAGALPDLVVTRMGTGEADKTIAAGYAAYTPDAYEIAAGRSLEIAAGACMEIG